MKASVLLLAAACSVLVAMSAAAWPIGPPLKPLWPPYQQPQPYFPYPPVQGEPALPPASSSGYTSPPAVGDLAQCTFATFDIRSVACNFNSFVPKECCTYLSRLGAACADVNNFYKSTTFLGILNLVCLVPFNGSPTSS